MPGGPGVRNDGGVEAGADVPVSYDPLISKLVTWGEDRLHAVARMRRALQEFEVLGIRTTVPFFAWMLRQPRFIEAAFHTEYLDEVLHQRQGQSFSSPEVSLEEVAALATAVALETAPWEGGVLQEQRATGPERWGRTAGGHGSAGRSDRVAGSSWARRARLDALRQ